MTTDLQTPTAFALNPQWLEQKAQPTTMVTASINTTKLNGVTNNTGTVAPLGWANDYRPQSWPNSNYWYYYPTADHRPIKLGMSEVEKLRSAAKRDAKLKKILEKFTDQIEVVVDFK